MTLPPLHPKKVKTQEFSNDSDGGWVTFSLAKTNKKKKKLSPHMHFVKCQLHMEIITSLSRSDPIN